MTARQVCPREEKSSVSLLLLGLLGLGLVVVGLLLALVLAGRVRAEAGLLRGVRDFEAGAVEAPPVGTLVVVTGRLEPQPGAADAHGLVVYAEEVWSILDNDAQSAQDYAGSWDTVLVRTPPCNLACPGGRARLAAGPGARLELAPWEFTILVPAQGQEVDGVREGTVRRRGFKAGDQVTVFGRQEDAGIAPQRYFGGDRAGLERQLSHQLYALWIVGGVFGLVGLALVVTAGVLWRKGGGLR